MQHENLVRGHTLCAATDFFARPSAARATARDPVRIGRCQQTDTERIDKQQTGLYSLPMATTNPKAPARQRLIETAERLFYAEGIRAVGIDRIIAEAGVAKMTLYNHFSSKDELVLAVLQYRDQLINEFFESAIQRYVDAGTDPLSAFFAALKEWFSTKNFRGCAFINAFIELADPTHAAARFSVQHKQTFHALINRVLVEAHGPGADQWSPAVALMVEGAIVMAAMTQSAAPADTARDAARTLASQ